MELQIIRKIIGPIQPLGETNADNERLENISKHIYVTVSLLQDLMEASENKGRTEYSMKKIGEQAYKGLREMKEFWLSDI